MFVLFFLIQCHLCQTIHQLTKANEFGRLPSKIGQAINKANFIPNREPSTPFQTIQTVYTSKLITIRNSLEGITQSSSQFIPTIVFDRFQRLANFRDPFSLNLTINHTVLNGLEGSFVFKLSLIFMNTSSPTVISYYGAQFVLSQNQLLTSNDSPTILKGVSGFLTSDNKTFFSSSLNQTSFHGSFDLDVFISELTKYNLVSPLDLFDRFEITGLFKSGSYETKLDFDLTCRTYVYYEGQLLMEPSTLKFYLQDLYKANGQIISIYQNNDKSSISPRILFSASTESNSIVQANFVVKINQTLSTGKFQYFPLDPQLPAKFIVSFYHIVTCDFGPCRVPLCFIMRYATKIVQVCSQNLTGIQVTGTFIKLVKHTDLDLKTSANFNLYLKVNTTQASLPIYYFLPPTEFKSRANLLFFASWLIENKYCDPDDRIIQFSRSLKVYQGKGTIQNLTNLALSDSASMPCLNKSYYFNLTSCVLCEMQGCRQCYQINRCAQCNTENNWIMSGISCVCQVGYCSQGTKLDAVCISTTMIGCLGCSNSTSCTNCDTSKFWVFNPTLSTCMCNIGYCQRGTTVTATCLLTSLSGCQLCSDSTNCISCKTNQNWIPSNQTVYKCVCAPGFYQIGANAQATCSTCMAGCVKCVNLVTCQICDTAHYWVLNTSTNKCDCGSPYATGPTSICNSCGLAGCMECSAPGVTECKTCSEIDNWILNGSNCRCNDLYYQVSVGLSATCVACEIMGCLKCLNPITCTACNTSLGVSLNPLTSICQCPETFYLSTIVQISCKPCLITACLKCINPSICTLCNSSSGWLLTNSICSCGKSFYSTNTVNPICLFCGSGCLRCNNQSVCLMCDKSNNWISISEKNRSYCKCNPGYFQNKDGNFCTSYFETRTALTCLLLKNGNTLDDCLNAQLSIQTQMIMTVTSTPYLGLFFSISQISGLIDDFTFYVYLNITYGYKFDTFIRYMWNLTNEKWIPSQVSFFYYQIQDSYNQKVKVKNKEFIPEPWTNLEENSNFVGTTRDFWISSIPFSCLVFLVLHFVYKGLAYCRLKIKMILMNFKWLSIMIFPIFSQNIQLLSFRAFQQIFFSGPPSAQPFYQLHLINQILCFILLFLVLISAFAGYFIIRILIQMNVKSVLDLVQYSPKSICFLIILNFFKVMYGFINASFYIDNMIKVGMLLSMQIFLLFSVIYFRNCFRLKSMLLLMVIQYILRVLINFSIIFRVFWINQNCILTQLENQTIGDIEIIIIIVLLVLCGMQVLTGFIPEKIKSQNSIKTPKINQRGCSEKAMSRLLTGSFAKVQKLDGIKQHSDEENKTSYIIQNRKAKADKSNRSKLLMITGIDESM